MPHNFRQLNSQRLYIHVKHQNWCINVETHVKDPEGKLIVKKEIVLLNRHSLESIEATRGNTANLPPNYFINGQQRLPSLPPDFTLTFPSKWINPGLFLMAVTTTTRAIFLVTVS